MIDIKYVLKNILRNKNKSLVTILVSSILVLFLLYYVFLLNSNEFKVNKIYDTTDIAVKVERKDNSNVKKHIPYQYMVRFIEKSKMFDYKYYTADYQCILKSDGLKNFEDVLIITPTTDINREILISEFKADITYADGYDENLFVNAKENTCIVSRQIMEQNNLKLGEKFKIYAPNEVLIEENNVDMILAGVYDINTFSDDENYNNGVSKNAIYCSLQPFSITALTFYYKEDMRINQQFIVSETEYTLKDARDVEKFKTFLREKTSFFSENPMDPLLNAITVRIYDDELKEMLGPVQSITKFMELALPFILVIIGTIAFGVSYLMTQSRITDIALMRAMGLKTFKIYKNIIHKIKSL